MVIRPNVLRLVKASHSHLDPVIEDSFVHCKGATASVTEAAFGLGRGAIARWFALGPSECTDREMNVGEECRARCSATHPTVTVNGAERFRCCAIAHCPTQTPACPVHGSLQKFFGELGASLAEPLRVWLCRLMARRSPTEKPSATTAIPPIAEDRQPIVRFRRVPSA